MVNSLQQAQETNTPPAPSVQGGPALAPVWLDPTQMLWGLPLSFICKWLGACVLKPESQKAPFNFSMSCATLEMFPALSVPPFPHLLHRPTKGPISYNCCEAGMRELMQRQGLA